MQIGIELEKRLTISVYAGNSDSVHPLVSGIHLGADARHFCGDASPERMPLRGAECIAQRSVRSFQRRQCAAERINGSQLHISIELFPQCDAGAPTAGGAPVIGKSVRKIILEIIGSGKAVAAAEDGHVAVVIMETGDLQFATRADLALRSQFLVLAALQDRASPAPEQRGKSIQFIQRSRQRTPGLRVTRFQRSGAAGHRSKNQRSAPVVGNANIDFRAWAYGRCRGSEAYQDVLAAIAESHPVAEG